MPTLIEVFVDKLDLDLARRRREIVDLRVMVGTSAGERLSLLARACHVVSYAHWEGFVKFALREYLDLVLRQNETLGCLQISFHALAIQKYIRSIDLENRTVSEVTELLKRTDGRNSDFLSVAPEEVITAGNLTAKKLEALLSCVGLEYLPIYQLRENYIDEILCGRRHRIAHGVWQPITADEAHEVSTSVLELCAEVNDQVQTAAVYQQYKQSV
ncbi:MAE_28990/MAE_18760 family HEPN-like nuclease [Mycobacteroides saopaulense]|uniref:MAE_28990/MAE_18760 family HEPN-like nuclease n=1 Tax=Mycobacteroides saopaulense TaxID=1578165 RepID=UPI00105666C2|nr:MAE_28990/MAE_18760 family HEPN-like nuclease [Mycobacteroides saopaulense]